MMKKFLNMSSCARSVDPADKMLNDKHHKYQLAALCLMAFLLTACGFHPQGDMRLAQPLKKMYLQTPDPYGTLAHNLHDYLKMSKVILVSSSSEADTVLAVERDSNAQELLSVAGTQQTRQYKLIATVIFSVSDRKGRVILAPQTLSETRTITVQANQILGSSNEAKLYEQQMRRALAIAIMNRLASVQVTKAVNDAFSHEKNRQAQ
jgi:LPS-assembly lipoprotein